VHIDISDAMYVPIGQTDSLRIKDFLHTDSVNNILEILNGIYVISIEDNLNIEVPEIAELEGFSIDIDILDIVNFGDFTEFPELQFNTDEVAPLETVLDSEFWLPQSAIDLIRGHIGTGSISLGDLNALAQPGSLLYDQLQLAGMLSFFPLPLLANIDTIIDISIDELLNNPYIVHVDTIWLTTGSGFNIHAETLNVPSGVESKLNRLRLEFPSQVTLNTNSKGVTSKNTFEVTNITVTPGIPLNLFVPVLYFTNIYENGSVVLMDSIKVSAEYSLIGSYNGGYFPNDPTISTRLNLSVDPSLTFGSSIVTLNTAIMDMGVPRTAYEFEIDDVIPDDITIVSLDSIAFQDTKIELNLKLKETNGVILNNLRVNVRIEFPKDIMFSTPIPNNVFEEVMTFTNNVPKKLTFNARSLKSNITSNTIYIKDSIVVQASASLINPTINTQALENIKLEFDVNGGFDANFSKIYAKIKFDIPWNEDVSMDLSNLPGIIMDNRDSIVLDVNPYLDLKLKTNLQIPFGTDLILKSYKNNSVINTLSVPISIAATTGVETETKFWIARSNTPPPAGQGYTFIPAALDSVIRQVPDSIVIRMDGEIDNNAIFDFNIDYFADMDYKFEVPLAFGDDFRIVIRDTMELNSIIGEMLNGNKITLAARVLNEIPLDVTATIIPIDEDHNPLSGVTFKPFTIKAGTKMEDPPTDIVFDDSDNNQLINMRGIILLFDVKAGTGMSGVPLKPDDFIQMRLNAKIEGGITIDLNNL
jgi:hypothetical protein